MISFMNSVKLHAHGSHSLLSLPSRSFSRLIGDQIVVRENGQEHRD
jgi:hypothetical protein